MLFNTLDLINAYGLSIDKQNSCFKTESILKRMLNYIYTNDPLNMYGFFRLLIENEIKLMQQ